ncbi:hypothetical protein NDU88_002896 [Pleurodeles waltl]|uniref:Secreted protein n=1 Tax=Pleurodeles waltl TaxID=8319 RepID=A0AAV7WMG5_PLEWA|nr:hypothetical protein NDU88_002896 [Pleurodeles waltl]
MCVQWFRLRSSCRLRTVPGSVFLFFFLPLPAPCLLKRLPTCPAAAAPPLLLRRSVHTEWNTRTDGVPSRGRIALAGLMLNDH